MRAFGSVGEDGAVARQRLRRSRSRRRSPAPSPRRTSPRRALEDGTAPPPLTLADAAEAAAKACASAGADAYSAAAAVGRGGGVSVTNVDILMDFTKYEAYFMAATRLYELATDLHTEARNGFVACRRGTR